MLAEARERFPEHARGHPLDGVLEGDVGRHGRRSAALRAAFELEPKCAGWAKNDADLDPIRGLPGSPV